MALTLVGTFTPSGYAQFATAQDPGISTTFTGFYTTNPRAIPTAIALPAGSTPATVLISNAGPEPCWVSIAAATATTTGTATAGSTAVTLASGTSVAVGQVVVGAGIAPGTFVLVISGTALTLSQPTTAALSTTALNFVTPVTPSTGTLIQPGVAPLALAYVSSGFVCALCLNASSRSVLNISVGE